MAVDGSLIFDTKINTEGFQKGRKSITNSLDGMKSAVLKFGATLGAIFGVKQIIEFGKKAVESAAEINAANSQLEQTFGSLKDSADEAMQRVADASGIVKTRLQGIGTSIYAFAKTSGMESSQALKMMEDALNIAADSAAYYDRSLEETSESLKSFLKGNFENDAALGLSCTETTRNITANKLYGKSFQELSESQKQLTLLQMVKDANELSGAMGQASRESDGLENVLGNLKESWKQLLAVIGQPILQATISIIQQMTSALSRLTEYATNAVNALSKVFGWNNSQNNAISDSASSVSNEIADSVDNQNELTEAVEETVKAEEKSLAGFDEINKLSDNVNSDEIKPEIPDTNTKSESETASATTTVKIETETDINSLVETIERIKAKFDELAKPVKIAWEDNSPQLIESIQSAFEKIKELAKSVGQSFADIWTNGTGEQYISNIIILFTDVFNIIGDIAGALKEAWNDNGTGDALIQSYFDRWNALLELIHTIADDFREVWNDGTGVEICKNIFEIITNINETVANLRERFKLAWKENNTGRGIIQGILNIFKTILKTINDITSDTKEWSEKLDFSPLLTSIQGLLKSLEPLTENIGSGLEWFYKNVLLPLASWTIEDVIPAFLDLLSGALSALNSVIEVLKPLAKWLWDSFLEPIAEWTGGIIVFVIKGLANALKDISDWISEHQEGVTNFLKFAGIFTAILAISKIVQTAVAAFTAMGGILGLVTGAATLLAPVISALSGVISLLINPITLVIAIGLLLIAHWDEVKEAAINAWDNITIKFQSAVDSIKEIFGNIGEWFSERWNDIKEVFSVVGEWFKIIFSFAWEQIKSAWSDVKNWFSLLWTGIKEVFSVVADWFKSKFSNAWDNIKKAWSNVITWFSDIWDSIKIVFSIVGEWFKSKFKTAWDNITSIFSGIGEWFSNRWKDISSAFSDVGNWFRDKFQNAWNNITSIFSGAGKWFSERWNDITSIFSGVDGWFSDKFRSAYNGITDIFSDIGGFFSGIWENISDGAKSGVNWVIDTINGLVDAAESAVNFIIDCINSLSFDIPDFVPSIGGTHVGFDIPWVNIPDIPHLANGTVVPANYGEFLAVLGDNKKEREFVAPESALKNALAEAMAQMNGIKNDIVVNVSMFPNERAFQQYIIKAEKNIQARGGRI